MKEEESTTVGVLIVMFLALPLFLFYLSLARVTKGFHIQPNLGGSCVVAEVDYARDPVLFCSDDIFAVRDALRRYRSMPLGGLSRMEK